MSQLSDLLLLCSPRKSMISGPQFSLRAKFEVEKLEVLEGDNLVTANTFYVRDEQKSVELYTGTRQDKEEWLEFLFLAIKSLYTRKSSLRVGRDILRPLDSEIGKKQPHMQKLENVQRCSECSAQFSILKHKHNCRFCGAVSTYYSWKIPFAKIKVLQSQSEKAPTRALSLLLVKSTYLIGTLTQKLKGTGSF